MHHQDGYATGTASFRWTAPSWTAGYVQFGFPTNLGPVYRITMEAAPHIRVYLNANVVAIDLDEYAMTLGDGQINAAPVSFVGHPDDSIHIAAAVIGTTRAARGVARIPRDPGDARRLLVIHVLGCSGP